VIRFILSGEYTYPVRIVAFHPREGWRRDATSDNADAVARRAVHTDTELSPALQGFITANSARTFDVQLSLPLRGAV
jgi:hypothetical protein